MTRNRRVTIMFAALATILAPLSARAEWSRDSTSIAWKSGAVTIGRFSFHAKSGKPF